MNAKTPSYRSEYARRLKRREGRLGDTWHLDELFVNIQGQRQYLWSAVDQDGDVIDILVQSRRNRRAAERFFRRLKGQASEPWQPNSYSTVSDRGCPFGLFLPS